MEIFKTNKDLIDYLQKTGVLKTKEIITAFLKIDRKFFVPEEYLDEAYGDYPLPIGYGQTISQPWTVAFMLELLEPRKDQKILDIGFGSGWTSCLLAEIVGEKGKVYAIEIVPEVFEFGKKNIEKFNFLEKGRVELFLADGSKGLPEKAPFDRILVSASAEKIPQVLIDELNNQGILVSASAEKIPQVLIDELNNQGILVIPVKDSIYKVKKINGKIEKEEYYGFAFVPLIEK